VRDLLVRLAMTDLFQAKWTDEILDEMVESILRTRDDLTRAQLDRTRRLMSEAVRDCMVTGYEDLVGALTLPDEDDRHVLAAAIRAGAQVIVTENLKDFPTEYVGTFGIEAQSTDDFVMNVLDLNESRVVGALYEQAGALKNPTRSVAELLDTLHDCGLVRSVARLRTLLNH
jgi:hypothetical protein